VADVINLNRAFGILLNPLITAVEVIDTDPFALHESAYGPWRIFLFANRSRLKPSHHLASPAPILTHRDTRTEFFDGVIEHELPASESKT
jgi:hypothetical protein